MPKAGPCYPGHVPIRTMDPREDEERKEAAENEKTEKRDSKWLLGVFAVRPGLMTEGGYNSFSSPEGKQCCSVI